MEVEKRRKTIINVLYFAIIIAFILLAVRYALGVCMPFVIAFIVAAILQKPKNFLVKKTPLKNGLASGICVLLTIIIFIALISLIGVRVASEVKGFIDYIVIQLRDFDKVIDNIEAWLINLISSLPEFLRNTLGDFVSGLFVKIREASAGESEQLAGEITGGLAGNFSVSWITTPISGVISTASKLPSILIAVVITIVACCFMTSEFPAIANFIKIQFPENKRGDLERAKVILKDSLSKMAKAYLLIMLVTFIEISVGLTILRFIGVFESNYIVIIAVVVAIVDIIPVLGTGTVIIPWAIYSFIIGNVGMGIGLLVIYAVVSVLRQVIEPKLVAGQLGLSPIITIAALYFGLKIFGVLGMFVTPLLIIMLKLLNDEGIIRLWKSPVREAALAKEKEEAQKEKEAEEKK